MINELRNKSNKELGELVVKMKSKLLEYRFRDASGELDGTHKMKMFKKTIAIALTVLSERNIKLSLSSNDHALIEIKDGKRLTVSFKEKGSNSIVFDQIANDKVIEDTNKDKIGKVKKPKISKTLKLQTSSTTEKKITTSTDASKSGKSKYSNIRKSTGRGQ